MFTDDVSEAKRGMFHLLLELIKSFYLYNKIFIPIKQMFRRNFIKLHTRCTSVDRIFAQLTFRSGFFYFHLPYNGI